MRLVRGISAALAAAAAMAAPAAGQTMKLHSLKAVSGKTPFSACPFEAPPPFTNNEWQPPDTALEPHIAVDPKRPNRIAAAWMQDFTSGIVVAFSHDRGRSWQRSIVPKLGECTGTEGATADPRLSFGPDGVLYLSAMRNIHLGAGRTSPDDEVSVSVSPDGGRTWRDPVVIQGRDAYNDYPMVAADPDVPGRVYVTFTRAVEPFGNALGTMFSVSEDGGRTFSAPRKIFETTRTGHYYNGSLVAQPGGRVLALLWVLDGVNYLPVVPDMIPQKLTALESRDGGRTWAAPVVVGEQSPTYNAQDPESGAPLRSGNPTLAAAPDGGRYLAWHDIDGRRSRLNVVRGRPDGTWEAPREVLPWAQRQIFFPLVAVTPEGTIGLMWFDSRNDRPDDGKYLIDAFFAESRDGGATYGREVHIAGPMDLREAWEDARSFNGSSDLNLGDYLGIAPRPKGFVAALPFTKPLNDVGRSQLFVADVREPAAKKKKGQGKKAKTRKKARREERRKRARARRPRR